MPFEKRVDSIVLVKNIVARVFIGMSDEKHQSILHELKNAGFVTMPVNHIIDYQDAEKLYDEAYQNYAVIVAIEHKSKKSKIIDNSNDFATFITKNKSTTLGVYVWYASNKELCRLAGWYMETTNKVICLRYITWGFF